MAEPTHLSLIAYGPDQLHEQALTRVDEIRPWIGRLPVLWVNVDGLGDEDVVRQVGALFGVHPLVLEDVLTQHERAKVDTYPEHDFIVVRMLTANGELDTEQLGVVLGQKLVVTFQEKLGDPFDEVRERLRKSHGLLRGAGPDALAYALLDAVVGSYFPVLERYGERLDDLEEAAIARPRADTLSAIHRIKRDLLRIRRAVWPLREALATLGREETPFVRPETRLYLRDLRDQAVQVADLIDNLRDIGASLSDLYVSSVSNRLNEVMKVLTIISTIFIPLSFITGLFGMNFDPSVSPWNMPLLRWRYGYPCAVLAMLLVAAGMLYFFRHKGWLGRDPD